MERRSTLAPDLAILLSALLWGTLWIPLRRIDEAGSNGAFSTGIGFMLPLALLLPTALRTWRRIVDGRRGLGMAGFWMASAIALYAEGLVRGQVARVILLFYLTPVWSTLLARFVLGQAISGRRVLTIILGLAGMVVILGLGARIPLPATTAEWMGLVAGAAWALAMVWVHRTASSPLFDRVFALFVFLGPVFFAVTLLPGRESGLAPEGLALGESAPWLVAFALLWMLPVIWLTVFGASRLDPGRVAIFLMAEVVVGLGTAAALTDEPFGSRELVGAALIMGAGGLEIGSARPRPPDSRREPVPSGS